MHLSLEQRELTLKLVYYGPALSGKTTNLSTLCGMVRKECRGSLITLDTLNDRTLFFDLLPVRVSTSAGFSIKIKLFTVPGQVMHNSTRRLVLSGSDGVAFVADSQKMMIASNNESWKNLSENLSANGLDPSSIPIVIQFNKRDLSSTIPDAEIDSLAKNGKEPVFKSVATTGLGVAETFTGLADAVWENLQAKHSIETRLKVAPGEFREGLSLLFKKE